MSEVPPRNFVRVEAPPPENVVRVKYVLAKHAPRLLQGQSSSVDVLMLLATADLKKLFQEADQDGVREFMSLMSVSNCMHDGMRLRFQVASIWFRDPFEGKTRDRVETKMREESDRIMEPYKETWKTHNAVWLNNALQDGSFSAIVRLVDKKDTASLILRIKNAIADVLAKAFARMKNDESRLDLQRLEHDVWTTPEMLDAVVQHYVICDALYGAGLMMPYISVDDALGRGDDIRAKALFKSAYKMNGVVKAYQGYIAIMKRHHNALKVLAAIIDVESKTEVDNGEYLLPIQRFGLLEYTVDGRSDTLDGTDAKDDDKWGKEFWTKVTFKKLRSPSYQSSMLSKAGSGLLSVVDAVSSWGGRVWEANVGSTTRVDIPQETSNMRLLEWARIATRQLQQVATRVFLLCLGEHVHPKGHMLADKGPPNIDDENMIKAWITSTQSAPSTSQGTQHDCNLIADKLQDEFKYNAKETGNLDALQRLYNLHRIQNLSEALCVGALVKAYPDRATLNDRDRAAEVLWRLINYRQTIPNTNDDALETNLCVQRVRIVVDKTSEARCGIGQGRAYASLSALMERIEQKSNSTLRRKIGTLPTSNTQIWREEPSKETWDDYAAHLKSVIGEQQTCDQELGAVDPDQKVKFLVKALRKEWAGHEDGPCARLGGVHGMPDLFDARTVCGRLKKLVDHAKTHDLTDLSGQLAEHMKYCNRAITDFRSENFDSMVDYINRHIIMKNGQRIGYLPETLFMSYENYEVNKENIWTGMTHFKLDAVLQFISIQCFKLVNLTPYEISSDKSKYDRRMLYPALKGTIETFKHAQTLETLEWCFMALLMNISKETFAEMLHADFRNQQILVGNLYLTPDVKESYKNGSIVPAIDDVIIKVLHQSIGFNVGPHLTLAPTDRVKQLGIVVGGVREAFATYICDKMIQTDYYATQTMLDSFLKIAAHMAMEPPGTRSYNRNHMWELVHRITHGKTSEIQKRVFTYVVACVLARTYVWDPTDETWFDLGNTAEDRAAQFACTCLAVRLPQAIRTPMIDQTLKDVGVLNDTTESGILYKMGLVVQVIRTPDESNLSQNGVQIDQTQDDVFHAISYVNDFKNFAVTKKKQPIRIEARGYMGLWGIWDLLTRRKQSTGQQSMTTSEKLEKMDHVYQHTQTISEDVFEDYFVTKAVHLYRVMNNSFGKIDKTVKPPTYNLQNTYESPSSFYKLMLDANKSNINPNLEEKIFEITQQYFFALSMVFISVSYKDEKVSSLCLLATMASMDNDKARDILFHQFQDSPVSPLFEDHKAETMLCPDHIPASGMYIFSFGLKQVKEYVTKLKGKYPQLNDVVVL